jgi:multidrug efflux system membrane fusion protein
MVYFFDMGTESATASGAPGAQGSGAQASGAHPASPAARPKRKRRWWLWLLLIGLVATAGYRFYPQVFAGNPKTENKAEKSAGKKGSQAVPVVATAARRSDLPIYLTGLGSVTAYNTVTIRSRVDGELVKVAFTEGQIVHQGDLLAEIDPRPYEAQLAQAEGQLANHAAQLENAKVDLNRYQALDAQRVIPRQQAETQAAMVHQLEGTLKADRGMIQNIALQLNYCHIVAPLTGRIGLRTVDQGNIVHAADPNGLATIAQLQPIAVVFNLAQDNLPQVLNKMRSGQTSGQSLAVEAYDRDLKKKLATGKLLTVDNAIDSSTGTVRFKAEFPNDDGSLFPNQFVNARLLVDTRHGIVTVPAAAIQHSPQSSFVYVVNSDQTVAMRDVVPGAVEGDDAAVDSGLKAGEIVVVDGVDKLQSGTKVEARVVGGAAKAAGASKGAGGAAKGAGASKDAAKQKRGPRSAAQDK